MPAALSYPGVYIEEATSGVRALRGVATSITAFVGAAPRGPVLAPTRLASLAEYERAFGGLSRLSPMSYAVAHFFANGGADAVIVRTAAAGSLPATASAGTAPTLPLEAASPGAWGDYLQARIDHQTRDPASPEGLFNLTLRDVATRALERFGNLSLQAGHARHAAVVLAQESQLARVGAAGTAQPGANNADPAADDAWTNFLFGSDGAATTDADVSAAIEALRPVDLFNLLVVPPRPTDVPGEWTPIGATVRSAAAAMAYARRAIYVADPPSTWKTVAAATAPDGAPGMDRSPNTAVYFPNILAPDPLADGRLAAFGPSGAVAGVIARTDASRGVWKAPAGLDAQLSGVVALDRTLTDAENGLLNPLGVNVLRAFPNMGRVVWGARTAAGSDALASDWKYLPVRRLALFLEESLYRGTQWVVFEPNDEPLWAQVRLTLGSFMGDLFRQGAFAGTAARDAWFVKCDRETTTPSDQLNGIVNIQVGFAPLRPAEFVVIRLQQMAARADA